MDTRDLTTALREATEGLEPRRGFADAVVTGGRRRRTRNRLTLATTVAGTAAVVTAVVVAGSGPLSAPPPPAASRVAPAPVPVPGPMEDWRLDHFAGEHVDDPIRTNEIIQTWLVGVRGGRSGPANQNGVLDQRLGDPHVYWADDTPYGEAAIVVQNVMLPADDRVPPEQQGQTRIATGLISTMPGSTEPRLLGVQLDDRGAMGHFLLPDDRTVVAVAAPDQAMWVSGEIRYDEDVSQRDWTAVPVRDGVGVVRLPDGTNPQNVRLVAGDADQPPRHEQVMTGAHLPLLRTATYPHASPEPAWHGLGWEGTMSAGEQRNLGLPPGDLFATAVRDHGILDPSSYTPRAPKWTVVAGTPDGRTVILGEWQELDHPSFLYAVTVAEDGRTVLDVDRGSAVDPEHPVVLYRLPDAAGHVAAAQGRSLRYEPSPGAAWTAPVADAVLVPPDAVRLRVDEQVVGLP